MASASTGSRVPPRATEPIYVPGRPEATLLYQLVQGHLDALVEYTKERYAKGLPRYVMEELQGYLRCGIFAHGFTRCHCDSCGHDLLVAFSCKSRGVCPSCSARRMCNEAAYLVDRVLPNVPIRQWVLSLPYELRGLAAFKPDVLTALGRIFVRAISSEQKCRAGLKRAECGAIIFPQRFGGSINLNLHLHVLVLDGVFTRDKDGQVHFHETPPPSPEELSRIVCQMRDRTLRWLRAHGYLDERPVEDRSSELPDGNAIEACADLALRGGAFAKLDRKGDAEEDNDAGEARFAPRRRGSHTFEVDGFNVQAAVRIEANDDEGRERLCRYCTDPALPRGASLCFRTGT